MRNCQISRQKTKYLRSLSNAILNGALDFNLHEQMSVSDIRRQLTSIKGIGNWTVDIYLMFCMQQKDIFPLGDIAVVNAALELTTAHNKEELAVISESWKPLRSLSAYFFWHYYLCKRNRRPTTW
jgi:DNA-3-methyladenine glycosylase II